MIKNHLKIAWRNLRKNPVFSMINILGLSIGLASTFLIYFWVSDEIMVDTFHANNDRLYQVMEMSSENNSIEVHEGTQGPLAEALQKDLPEVEDGITVMNLGKLGESITFKSGENTLKLDGMFTSKTFFDVFSFPLIHGTPTQVLSDKNSIVVSESFATKMFGSTENAINQEVEYNTFGNDHTAKVTGVYNDAQSNSTLKFDYVATKQKLLEDIWTNGTSWENTGPDTYILLKPNVDIGALNSKLKTFIDKYDENNTYTLFIRKFSDAYLKGNYENGVQNGGRITYVKLFSFIAILVLLIACINFMNLSTARVTRRFKEIGIKKTVGGTKKTLVFQFLTESLLITFISLILAMVLVIALTPIFNFITGKELGFNLILNNVLVILLAAVLTGLISGSYPAFYLSGFSPLASLKGKFQSKGAELFARKGLVIFQFMASLVLIISVLIISKQINYALTKPMGFQKENLVHFDLEGKAYQNTSLLLSEMKRIDGVEYAGGISESVIREDGGSSTTGIEWPGKNEGEVVDFIVRRVDENLIKTMGIQLNDGEAFSQDLGSPDSYLLLNEEAIRLMGIENPVGSKITLNGQEKTILGIMKNFHTASVIQNISPIIFRYSPNNLGMGMVRIRPTEVNKTIATMNELYTDYNPGYDFNFSFMDQTLNSQYLTQQRILSLSRYFAYLAIFISCLGLFGLAAFNTETRIKEIGIRKVLGASSFGILTLLSMDFLKLVVLSIIVATPIAWYFMNDWLLQFAYRIDIGWTVFVIAGLLALIVAFATTSFQAIKAANTNPVNNLRTE